jgi:hypothetical protein
MMKRKGDWIQTYAGRQFWPLDPRPEDICIEDIAHSLANQCRFNGHCSKFYSVAEHCFHVSKAVPWMFSMEGLLHDAAEAYLADVPRPIKPFLAGYKEIEDNILKVIYQKFMVKPGPHKIIKAYDDAILADEAEQIMPNKPASWKLVEKPLGITLYCWGTDEAAAMFLLRFNELK